MASAINNDVARVAGLLAVAVLPALAGMTPAGLRRPGAAVGGFHRAVLIAGAVCAAGGVLAFCTISDSGLRRSNTGRVQEPARRAEPVGAAGRCP